MKQTKTYISALAAIHGSYFCVSGIWPLIHMNSFLFVTGPKTDLWLVETVGVLVLVIGMGLLVAGFQKRISFPISIIAMGASLGLIFIDTIYVWALVISPVYLLDAAIEFVLLSAWIFYIFKAKLWKIHELSDEIH
jgi:hypothetical protein